MDATHDLHDEWLSVALDSIADDALSTADTVAPAPTPRAEIIKILKLENRKLTAEINYKLQSMKELQKKIRADTYRFPTYVSPLSCSMSISLTYKARSRPSSQTIILRLSSARLL